MEVSVITPPPPGKVGIYLKHFDIGYYLPSSNFLLELLDHHKIHINQLVPNDVNKITAFEILCQYNGIVHDIWVFRHFFHLFASSTGGYYTFCVRKYSQILIIDRKGSPKN